AADTGHLAADAAEVLGLAAAGVLVAPHRLLPADGTLHAHGVTHSLATPPRGPGGRTVSVTAKMHSIAVSQGLTRRRAAGAPAGGGPYDLTGGSGTGRGRALACGSSRAAGSAGLRCHPRGGDRKGSGPVGAGTGGPSGTWGECAGVPGDRAIRGVGC